MNPDSLRNVESWRDRNPTRAAIEQSIGKRITAVTYNDDEVRLSFEDGTHLQLTDYQCCCESRYITTDDTPYYLVGCIFVDVLLKNGPELSDELLNVHETAFLEIVTDNGSVVFQTHNEHNGYYGGFSIDARIA